MLVFYFITFITIIFWFLRVIKKYIWKLEDYSLEKDFRKLRGILR